MAENAILFSVYNGIQTTFRKLDGTYDPDVKTPVPLSGGKVAMAAAGAGAAVSLVLTPVELVKCKLQVQDMPGALGSGTRYRGPADVLVRTLRTEGLRGMYRGQLGTLIREGGGGVAWFGVYEVVINWMVRKKGVETKDELSPVWIAAAGGVAGMAFNGSMFPAGGLNRGETECQACEAEAEVESRDGFRIELNTRFALLARRHDQIQNANGRYYRHLAPILCPSHALHLGQRRHPGILQGAGYHAV
jgi:hypothetical protein